MMNLVDSVLPAPLSPLGEGGGEGGGGRGGYEARFTTPGKRGESESVCLALPADSPNEDTLVLSHPPHAVKHLVGDGVDVGGEVPQLLPHVLLHHLRPVRARNELVRVHRGQDGADVSLRRGRGRQPMRGADHTTTSSPASHPITPCSTPPPLSPPHLHNSHRFYLLCTSGECCARWPPRGGPRERTCPPQSAHWSRASLPGCPGRETAWHVCTPGGGAGGGALYSVLVHLVQTLYM